MGLAIGLLGDVMLGRGVGRELSVRAPEQLWSPELRALAESLDIVVANLECCISARGHPTTLVPGKPFFFRAPPGVVLALEAMHVRVVSLANNHVLDYGEEGLRDTLTSLDSAGIVTAGAGLGEQEARRPATVATDRGSVGVLALSDHPRQYAGELGHRPRRSAPRGSPVAGGRARTPARDLHRRDRLSPLGTEHDDAA